MNDWDPDAYSVNARFVSDLGAPLVELLDPRPGERVLDLGCGDGALSLRLIDRGATVVGVDSSEAMITAARARGIDARVVDGHALPFEDEFDAVFSNAALHWMTRADEVITGVRLALRPGGRFVAELGGHGCVAAVVTALTAVLARRGIDATELHPWYFPTPGDYTEHLERGGFVVKTMDHFPRPTPLPGALAAWLETFAGPFLVTASDPDAVRAEVEDLLRPSLCDEHGRWTVDYVRLRFSAERT